MPWGMHLKIKKKVILFEIFSVPTSMDHLVYTGWFFYNEPPIISKTFAVFKNISFT